MPTRGEYAMKFHKNFHVVAVAAALMMLGTQAAVVSSSDVLGAVSRWSSANGAAFSGPGVPVSATPAYDDDGTTVLYWIVTMSNGGAVIASPDTDLDLVVAVLEVYDGPLPEGHPLPDMLKNDMRNRLAVLAARNGASSSSGPRKQKAVASAAQQDGDALAKSITAANEQWAKYSGGTAGGSSGGTRLRKQKAATLAGGDSNPFVRRIVDGFESKGKYTFWNQDSLNGGRTRCFNAYTPGNVVCGCVATAGSAVLHFFNCTNNPGVVTSTDASYNGTKGTYNTIAGITDWSMLPTNLVYGTAGYREPNAVGYELLGRVSYNMGVLVDMEWAAGGSGAQTSKLADAFKKYGFTTARYISYSGKTDTNGQEFMKTLYAQLWCGAPAVLSIRGAPGGHAVVACGYARDVDGDEFCRVFMGWGGAGDNWYKFPEIDDFSQVQGAVTMLGYEDNAVVPIYGEADIPGEELTLPGYVKDGEPVKVQVDGNGYFGIRVPPTLTDTTIVYEPRGKSDIALPFNGTVLANEKSDKDKLDAAIPNEISFLILNMTRAKTMETGKAIASRDGKALLMVSVTPKNERSKALMDYVYHLDETTDMSNRFVFVYNVRSSSNPNEPDGDPSIGVFDPDVFVAAERWKETNGRLEYENFIDYDASGETGVTVYTFTTNNTMTLTNCVNVLLERGYDTNARLHSGIMVKVRGFNIVNPSYNEAVAVEPDYGDITGVWTNGEVAVFSAPGTYTNETEGVIYSCIGWATNEVSSAADAANYTKGTTAKIQLFANTTNTFTWIWDASHYRVTAGLKRRWTSGDEWNDAVTPEVSWVPVGGRAAISAKGVVGSYRFDYWEVKSEKLKIDYYNPNIKSEVRLYDNGTAVFFSVYEPVEVTATYRSGTTGVPSTTTNLLVLVSSPKELESIAPPPLDGSFTWGTNHVFDNVFQPVITDATCTDSTGGVWKCTGAVPASAALRTTPTTVTLVWTLQPTPGPVPPSPPSPPTPAAIAVSGIEQASDGSWIITVSGAVKNCWYWLYSADNLSKIVGDSSSWTADKAMTTESNPQQAVADGNIVFHAGAAGAKFYWRAKATSTEDGK